MSLNNKINLNDNIENSGIKNENENEINTVQIIEY